MRTSVELSSQPWNESDLRLHFHIDYTQSEVVERDTIRFTVDNFPFVIKEVAALPSRLLGIRRPPYGNHTLTLIVQRSEDIGPCTIFLSPDKFMLQNKNVWLYSYHASKGILHKVSQS